MFPGEHHAARFQVSAVNDRIHFYMKSRDGEIEVRLEAKIAEGLPGSSVFGSLAAASSFFEPGSLGYSVTQESSRLDGIRLATRTWKAQPLTVESVYSSYFSDTRKFPSGSVAFDCALLMQNIEHEWHNAPDLYV